MRKTYSIRCTPEQKALIDRVLQWHKGMQMLVEVGVITEIPDIFARPVGAKPGTPTGQSAQEPAQPQQQAPQQIAQIPSETSQLYEEYKTELVMRPWLRDQIAEFLKRFPETTIDEARQRIEEWIQ